MNTKRSRWKPIALAASIVIVLALTLFFQKTQSARENPLKVRIVLLPEFSTIDNFGNELNKESLLIGKAVYVQFIDPRVESQIDTLKSVYFNYKDYVNIVTFVKETERATLDRFLYEIRDLIASISIVSEEYDIHKKIFHSSACCESFHFFDESGKLIKAGSLTEIEKEGVPACLSELLGINVFNIYDFIPLNQNIDAAPWLSQVKELVNNEEKNSH